MRKKKAIEKWDGLIVPNLMNKIPGVYREILESSIYSIKSTASTSETINHTSLTVLETMLHYINNDKLPEVRMMKSILKQVPNAQYN